MQRLSGVSPAVGGALLTLPPLWLRHAAELSNFWEQGSWVWLLTSLEQQNFAPPKVASLSHARYYVQRNRQLCCTQPALKTGADRKQLGPVGGLIVSSDDLGTRMGGALTKPRRSEPRVLVQEGIFIPSLIVRSQRQ